MAYDPDEFDDGGDGIDIAELFTDRVTEAEAFAEALAAHRDRLDGIGPSPQGRNVLVFHGHGGIGKSELSKRLERWATLGIAEDTEWGLAPTTRIDATARVDLHGTQGHIDGAEQLARLRVQFAGLRPHWDAFDVAFAAYWASTHPTAPLPIVGLNAERDFVLPTLGLLRDLAVDLGTQADLHAPNIMAAAGHLVVRPLVDGIGRRLRRLRADVTLPPGYDDLFRRLATEPSNENQSTELLGRLAALLKWEIDHASSPVPLTVVHLDTFERLGLDHRRQGESLLNLVAYTMSNVLFVITGRNSLDWWELDGTPLPRRGPERWPLLIPGTLEEPRQHSLKYLSGQDRRILLRRIRDHHQLAMTDEVLDQVAEQSGGLPEYIRLATAAALNRRVHGQPITADAVTGSLESLVLRLMEDVPSDEERAAIRAASLFPQCTPALVAASAGVAHGVAFRALRRALFQPLADADGFFTMHDRVRAAIREARATRDSGWTAEDWRAAGSRALAHLRGAWEAARERYQASMDGAARDATAEGRSMLETVALAITVLAQVDADVEATASDGYQDWLSEAVVKGPSIAGLRPLVPASASTSYGRDLLDFITAKSSDLLPEQKRVLLRQLMERPGPLSWIAGRHLGYALANASEWDEALTVFDELLRRRPDSHFIRHQRALRLCSARWFRRASAALPDLLPEHATSIEARIRYLHGEPDAHLAWGMGRLSEHRDGGRIKDALELEGILIRRHAITHGRIPGHDPGDLRTLGESAGHESATRDALLSTVLLDGCIGDADLRWFVAADRARNDAHLGFREATLRAALATLAGDRPALEQLHREILLRERPRGSTWIPVEFLLESQGLGVGDAPGTEWLEDRAMIAARWTGIWTDWRERLGGAGAPIR